MLIELKIFGMELLDQKDLLKMLFRFSINILFAVVLLRFLYYSKNKSKEYLFSFLMTNVTIFFMCHLLSNVKINMGFALGLFAIFGIIRYRTNPIPIKEMTYLFTLITIAVINALANKKVSFSELLFTNIVIISFTFKKFNTIFPKKIFEISYTKNVIQRKIFRIFSPKMCCF